MSSNSNQHYEICDKIQIAKNILSKEPTLVFRNHPYRLVKTICYYTAVDKNCIEQLLIKMKAKKTFMEWLRFNSNSHKVSSTELRKKIGYEQIRNVIIDQYINSLQIPTKASIIEAITETVKTDEEYTPALLRQDLQNLGFIWKRLPKSDKYIVVENREQFSNRMKYFYQMQEFRKNKRVLIHVERTVPCFYYTSPNRAVSTEIIVVASPQLGLIDVHFPPKMQTLQFWLTKKLYTLPPDSVFVIEQSNRFGMDRERNCKLPTMHSPKTEMIVWLNTYNIPYDPNLHKGELFALIQKHKVHCPPLYRCCEILKAAGHDVIFRPPELTYIKYFKKILEPIFSAKIMSSPLFKKHVINTMNNVDPGYWLKEDQVMAYLEQKVYDEDQKLELLLDSLMENIKNKTLSVSDFEECDDGEFDSVFLDKILFVAKTTKKQRGLRPGGVHKMPDASKVSNAESSGNYKLVPSLQGPSKPRPSNPGPSNSGPSNPGPSNLGPSNPGPSNLGPSNPGPSNLGLSNPGPSNLGSSNPRPPNLRKSNPGPSNLGPSNPGPFNLGPSKVFNVD